MAKKLTEDLETGKTLLKDMTLESGHLYDALTSIGASIQTAIENALEGGEKMGNVGQKIANTYKKDLVNSIKESARSMDKLVGLQLKINSGQNASKEINNALLKNQAKQEVLNSRINMLKGNGVKISKKQQGDLIEILKLEKAALDALNEQNIEKQKSRSIFNLMGEALGGMADKLDKSGTLSGILKGNLKETLTAARLGQVASISFVKSLIDGIVMLDSIQTQYNKSFGLTDAQAGEIQDRMSNIADASGKTSITFLDSHKALAGMADASGILATGLRDDVLQGATELQKLLGFSNKGMTQLAFNAQVTGQNMNDQTLSMVKGLKTTEKELGVTMHKRKVLQEVSELSGLIRANFGRNVEAMTQTVAKAKAFGLTMQDLEGISSNLLNFQSSIEAELTAELFIGRQLNLEKARLYALTGDQKGLMDEILGQLGSEYEFLNMNVLAKQKFAAALGMSVNQLSDLVFKETELSVLMEQARAAEDEETLKMLEQRSITEKMADLMTKVQTSILSIADGPLGKFASLMSDILSSTGAFYTLFAAVAAIKLAGLITTIVSLARAIRVATIGGAFMSGALTGGLILVTGAIAASAFIATMNSTKPEPMETASYASLPSGQRVDLKNGEGKFHSGESVVHTADLDAILKQNNSKFQNNNKGEITSQAFSMAIVEDTLGKILNATRQNTPGKQLKKHEVVTRWR
jgi:hypothetical protein